MLLLISTKSWLERQSAEATQARLARRQAGELVGRIEGRAVRALTRNTGSIFLESVPIIGVAVLWGSVAWDVWDTCELLGDMRELDGRLSVIDGEETDIGATVAERSWCGLDYDEIFARLGDSSSRQERLCIAARLRDNRADPPECEDVDFPPPPRIDPPEPIDPPLRPTPFPDLAESGRP